MNVYELLRCMVDNQTWKTEGRKGDALATIDELERLNIFGSMAALMEAKAHDCVPSRERKVVQETSGGMVYYTALVCRVCGEIDKSSYTTHDRNG